MAPASPLTLRATTSMQANSEIGTYGSPVVLKAKLSMVSAAQPLAKLTITFKVDGVTVGSGDTDASGAAQTEFAIPSGFAIGGHMIEASFAGSAALVKSSAQANLAVLKATTKIKDSVIHLAQPGTAVANGLVAQPLDVSGQLVRATDGAPLGGRSIDIQVNSVTIGNVATDNQGGFKLHQPTFTRKPGKYMVQASFDNDSHYVGSGSAPKEVEVLAPVTPATITAYPGIPVIQPTLPIYIVGQEVTVSTKVSMLGGGYGPALPGVMVWIRPSGPSPVHKVLSNPSGIASATFRLDLSGKNSIGAAVVDPKYISGKVPGQVVGMAATEAAYTSVTVLPAPLSIQVQGPSSGKIGDQAELKVTLVNGAFANAPLDGYISLKAAGVTVTGSSNKITIPVTIPSTLGIGSKQIKVMFAGNDRYAASEGVWNVSIQAKDD